MLRNDRRYPIQTRKLVEGKSASNNAKWAGALISRDQSDASGAMRLDRPNHGAGR